MSTRKRRNHKPNNNKAIVSHQALISGQASEESAEELLFKPIVYKTSSVDKTVDFENLKIPFLIKDNLVFMMTFVDCCGLSVYVTCHEMNPKNPIDSYRNALPIIKECLKVEKLTGTEYYFGKLDKALEHYLYALRLFIDKDILTKEKALELVKELGVGDDDIEQASNSVKYDIEKSRMRDARMIVETKAKDAAAEMMMKFISSIIEEESPDKEEQTGE